VRRTSAIAVVAIVRITTEIAVVRDNGGMPIILAGLENGAAVAVRKTPKR
jgi:hypothetical protein